MFTPLIEIVGASTVKLTDIVALLPDGIAPTT
jgi:hypothetical protein